MILKNTRLNAEILLSHDLFWSDEHSWSPVVQSVEPTLSGASVVDVAIRQSGRTITLAAPRDDMAWHARSIVDVLVVWAAAPGEQFQLTLDDGRQFNVLFRHQEPPALEAKPVRNMATFDADDFWTIKLKFMEI